MEVNRVKSQPAKVMESKLSQVFKIPSSTPPRRSCSVVPESPEKEQPGHQQPEERRKEQGHQQPEERQAPEIGKGKGRKGASAFMKGSHTQQQIWKTQDNMESIENWLAEYSVKIFSR